MAASPADAGDRVQHHVARGAGGLHRRVGAGHDPRQPQVSGRPAAVASLGVEGELEVLDDGGAAHRDQRGTGVQSLPGEQLDALTACGQRDHPEPVGLGGDDLQGLGPDRAGAAQDHDVAHAASLPYVASARTAPIGSNEDMRGRKWR